MLNACCAYVKSRRAKQNGCVWHYNSPVAWQVKEDIKFGHYVFTPIPMENRLIFVVLFWSLTAEYRIAAFS